MPLNVKVLYLCDFDLSKDTGKDRATNQKLRALSSKVFSLKVISNNFKGSFFRLLSVVLLDLKALTYIVTKRPDWFISRGYAGMLSVLVAKALGVLTIREVHANALQESSLLPYRGIKLWTIKKMAYLSHKIDTSADVRIFNHPDLLEWYRKSGFAGPKDFYTYNGYDPESKCNISKFDARKIFGFERSDKIIVFVGSASKWHGVDYLVKLQKEFNVHDDNVKIAFGGGNIAEFDPEGLCVSFSPLSDEGCAQLVRAADFCALPVKSNRVSPGSPLKLYDYIVNERFILAQSDTNGYSDEVERFSIGVPIDFTDSIGARRQILSALQTDWSRNYPMCPVSWSDRMDEWVEGIERKITI
jgi:glycosyltransferase involved in cell wall biosynthesis